jgi:2-polyprenyl-3-methyl-5-hydroxy-6-metoxy-1,4-benzoquinol methylase
VLASNLEYLHRCPICHHRELDHYSRVPSLFNDGEYIRYEKCRDCGTVLRNPRLPPEYRLARYEEPEMSAESKRLKPKNQVHYAYMMKTIERLLPPGCGRRLFDFGCGSGGFLLEAKKAGFDVMGLELSKDLAQHVEGVHGIPVYQGLASDPEFQEKFDVIISSQVFEHLLDPRQTLEALKERLNRPGLILIEVPNQNDIRERLKRGRIMNDSHLFYFSASSLSRMLRDQCFRVVKAQEGMRPYRKMTDPDHTPAPQLMELGARLMSVMQVKTGLSVFAILE